MRSCGISAQVSTAIAIPIPVPVAVAVAVALVEPLLGAVEHRWLTVSFGRGGFGCVERVTSQHAFASPQLGIRSVRGLWRWWWSRSTISIGRTTVSVRMLLAAEWRASGTVGGDGRCSVCCHPARISSLALTLTLRLTVAPPALFYELWREGVLLGRRREGRRSWSETGVPKARGRRCDGAKGRFRGSVCVRRLG